MSWDIEEADSWLGLRVPKSTVSQVEELSLKLELSKSDVVRNAIDLLWERSDEIMEDPDLQRFIKRKRRMRKRDFIETHSKDVQFGWRRKDEIYHAVLKRLKTEMDSNNLTKSDFAMLKKFVESKREEAKYFEEERWLNEKLDALVEEINGFENLYDQGKTGELSNVLDLSIKAVPPPKPDKRVELHHTRSK